MRGSQKKAPGRSCHLDEPEHWTKHKAPHSYRTAHFTVRLELLRGEMKSKGGWMPVSTSSHQIETNGEWSSPLSFHRITASRHHSSLKRQAPKQYSELSYPLTWYRRFYFDLKKTLFRHEKSSKWSVKKESTSRICLNTLPNYFCGVTYNISAIFPEGIQYSSFQYSKVCDYYCGSNQRNSQEGYYQKEERWW